MADEPSFEISQVALMLSMPQTRVKNWTIGRPLAIKPSVRRAKGAGTSNLYGPQEVFLLGLAQHLADDGLGMEAVEEAVKRLSRTDAAKGKYLLIYRPAKGAAFERKRVHVLAQAQDLTKLFSAAGPASAYVLDLGRFQSHINEAMRIETIFNAAPPVKLSRKERAAMRHEDED